MSEAVSQSALNTLFYDARTHNGWQDRPVSDATLAEIYELVKMGPTSANCSPARFVFIRSEEGKERLRPALSSGNLAKTLSAPVTAIVAWDAAFRNSSMQAAYLIAACRALGLDTGPMSGFDRALVDKTFFSDTPWRSNLLVNIGYGDASKLYGRLPRLAFNDACQLI